MRRLIFLFLCLSLIFTSCQGKAPTSAPGSPQTEGLDNKKNQTAYVPALTPDLSETASPTLVEVAINEQPAGCSVVSPRPTPGPTEQSIFPLVSNQDWVFGPQDASITLLEYSDFQ